MSEIHDGEHPRLVVGAIIVRDGLVLADGAGVSLTVQAFIDHCRSQITLDSTPGLHLKVPGALRGSD